MKDFSKIYKEDEDIVGKKAVELAELVRLGIRIPDGFVITTSFFKKFLDQTGISEEIQDVEKINHPAISSSVEKLFDPIRMKIMRTHIPENLILELHKFYRKLCRPLNECSLNIFTSSLNNKPMSFLNIKGDANLILKIKEIWALHIGNPVAIIVQKNIKSKNKGVIVTNDPSINNKNLIYIAKKIQKHFYFPKVVEYAIEKGKIFVTGIKPFTGAIEKLTVKNIIKWPRTIVKGISINPGIVTGHVKLFNNRSPNVKKSEIVVTKNINKSLYNKFKKARGIVADEMLLSPLDKLHYKKVIKIPTIIATQNATKLFKNGNVITVNGITGEIYSGGII